MSEIGKCPRPDCDGFGHLASHTRSPIPNRCVWYVQCTDCEVRGPADDSLFGAIQGWRAVQSALSTPGDAEWISVEDELPETDTYVVLVSVTGEDRPLIGWYLTRDDSPVWRVQPAFGKWFETKGLVTHWRPLPDGPGNEG